MEDKRANIFSRQAYVMPVAVEVMNWNSVILVGTVVLTTLWWIIHARKNYPGPKLMELFLADDAPPVAKGQL